MYVVYGLEDQRNNEVFYVGVTNDIQARFASHMRCDGSNPLKDVRIQEMRADGYLPFMRTLQIVPDEHATKRESYWIRHYYDLGAPLTNQVIPVVHHDVVIVREVVKPEPALKLRAKMSLDEQREYIFHLLDQGLSRRKILAKVDGYIHSKVANSIIDESVMQPLVTSVGKAIKEVVRTVLTVKDVPEMLRKEIEERYLSGMNRTSIRDDLELNGDQYWMIRVVCDECDQRKVKEV